MSKSEWSIDSFSPSDGVKKSDGLPPDHQAWLRGPNAGSRTNYIHLQFSTWGIGPEAAKTLVDKIVEGLNQ